MKRGRPSKGTAMREAILGALEHSPVPLTVSTLSRIISENSGSKISWNTTQKYLRELVETNRVRPIPLPHSKKPGKTGLTVYELKK